MGGWTCGIWRHVGASEAELESVEWMTETRWVWAPDTYLPPFPWPWLAARLLASLGPSSLPPSHSSALSASFQLIRLARRTSHSIGIQHIVEHSCYRSRCCKGSRARQHPPSLGINQKESSRPTHDQDVEQPVHTCCRLNYRESSFQPLTEGEYN